MSEAAVPLVLKLLAAHLIGDFALQPTRLAHGKRRPAVLALHVAVHGVLLALVAMTEPRSARIGWALGVVLAAHAVIDAWTSRVEPRNVRIFALDQSLHLASLALAAAIGGTSSDVAALRSVGRALQGPDAWVVLCGALLAVPVGATAIGRWIQPFAAALSRESQAQRAGLELAGRWIGMLERALIYLAVLAGLETLIGFVVAAKAVLRLPEAREKWSRELAEYYLLGSLASLAWALLTALMVRGLVARG